jgi:serine/threonine protein kinase
LKNKRLIGSTLANFKVQRLVARGGMADVYYGTDINLHRQVAIKVFDVESRSRSSQINRFQQEARMMANWRHENIIQIFYAGDEAGLFYYVMEYVDGYDLASIISVYQEKGELMPIDDILRIGDSIANALDYAHSQNVIHRDVKPANVLVANSDGRVVLGDFGLALDLNDKTQGDVFGSPHYIAPEQARRSSDAVPQSDLYALGVILYEMFTGATTFNDPAPGLATHNRRSSIAAQH